MLWEILRPFRRAYLRYLGGTILRQALIVTGGYSMVWALRVALQHRQIPEWWLIVALVLFDGAYLTLDTGLNAHFARRLSLPMFARLRTTSLEKVFQMPLEWHQKQTAGALVAKVNNGVGRVVQTGEAVSRELCPSLIRTGFSLVPLLVFSVSTAPVLLGALVLFGWLTVVENRRREMLRRGRHEKYVRDSSVFSEYVQSVQPVIQFGQGGRLVDEYRCLQQQILDEGLEEMVIASRFSWRKNLVLSAAKRICQGIWLWQLRQGRVDAAMLMYLNMLTEDLLGSFWGYAGMLERIYEGLEPTRMLLQLLQEAPGIADAADAVPVQVPEQIGVKLVNVRFAYARGKQVIHDFNLAIEEGKVLGVVGRSGSGKTTIQSLLSRLFDAQHGQILVSGIDIRKWPLEQLRSVFAYVSQAGGVFLSGNSIADTIRFARPESSFREVVQAAKCACIHEDIVRMRAKYQTRLRQGGSNLSKGQQQRLALAQALLALKDNRKVVVLDEFTSQLDSDTESRILRNLAPWLAGRTVIIVAHRLSTVRHIADQIVVLEGGAIVEQGSHEELVRQNGWYAEMARLQAVI
jgi:ABC-type multidrug transport system fused ATPase/permease subunit